MVGKRFVFVFKLSQIFIKKFNRLQVLQAISRRQMRSWPVLITVIPGMLLSRCDGSVSNVVLPTDKLVAGSLSLFLHLMVLLVTFHQIQNLRACRCRDSPDYSSVISRFERLIHDPRTPRKLSAFYALKLARFHAKTRNDRRLAEKIIRDAINRDKVRCADSLYWMHPYYSG